MPVVDKTRREHLERAKDYHFLLDPVGFTGSILVGLALVFPDGEIHFAHVGNEFLKKNRVTADIDIEFPFELFFRAFFEELPDLDRWAKGSDGYHGTGSIGASVFVRRNEFSGLLTVKGKRETETIRWMRSFCMLKIDDEDIRTVCWKPTTKENA